MKVFIILSLIIFNFSLCWAQNAQEVLVDSLSSAKSQYGVSASVAGGLTNFSIQTANSKAIYSGLGVSTHLAFPLWQNEMMSFNAEAGYRYMEGSNNANVSNSKEFVRHMGPGIGLNYNIYRIVFGINYYRYQGNHFWVGSPQGELDYSMDVLTYYGGLHFSVSENVQMLFSYDNSTGKVPKDRSHLSIDAPYSSSTFWIHLSYSSGESLSALFKRLFN